MTTRTKTILGAVVLLAVLIGAGAIFTGTDDFTGSHPSSAHTMTLDAAKQRARQNAFAVVAALPVTPLLDPPDGTGSGGACSQGLENDLTGQYDSSVSFHLQGVSPDHKQDVIAAVRAFAAQHDFKPLANAAGVESFKDRDGFTISIGTGFDPGHTLTLSSSTPCVWPNGTRP